MLEAFIPIHQADIINLLTQSPFAKDCFTLNPSCSGLSLCLAEMPNWD